jgi:hypothetical protein
MELLERPAGAYYVVVLRNPDFSMGRVAMRGAFGGSDQFPRPDLGEKCVCCDAPSDGTVSFDAGSDRWRVDPIQLPVCEGCRPHVARSTTGAQLAGAVLCIGIGGALYGAADQSLPIAAAGGVVLAGTALWILRSRAARAGRAAEGHHDRLEIGASPGQCAVRTTNRRLAEELISRNRDRVYRAK